MITEARAATQMLGFAELMSTAEIAALAAYIFTAVSPAPTFSEADNFASRVISFASRDGWITKFDIWNLKLVAEIRAGINTRNVAISADGKVLSIDPKAPATESARPGFLRRFRSPPHNLPICL